MSFFITTAIDYVNGRPHLGHAYEKVLADTISRYMRSLGREVFFLTGVDEHGQKVQQSAQRLGRPAADFCDEMTGYFLETWRMLSISYDAFVRTTSPKHKAYVRLALQKLHDNGDITFKPHEGFYSVRQEQFVTEKDMVDGRWPEIYGEVIRTSEPNYFFNLEKYRRRWVEILNANSDWIVPAFRRNELLNALDQPLDDLCISRPRSRLEWGIPLPFDQNYVTYVWFDALLNYASFADEAGGINRWPADLQVIGKDILIPAHGVYWPLMLLALDMPPPKRLLVHGWWQMRGQKMSKSTGTAVNPMELVQKYGPDAFRYYLLREMSTGHDADFSVEGFHQRYTSDLGNDLGNLLQRTVSMTHRYLRGSVPPGGVDATLEEHAGAAFREFYSAMEFYETNRALEGVWKYVRSCNRYLEEKAPWKMARDAALKTSLEEVLRSVLKACVRVSVLIEPFMPVTAAEMRRQLGISTAVSLSNWDALPVPAKAGEAVPLFPRMDIDVVE